MAGGRRATRLGERGDAGRLEQRARHGGGMSSSSRLPMRKVREILRLKMSVGLSHRDVATSVGASAGVVSKVMARAEAVGLTWDEAAPLTEEALDVRLF